MLSHFIIIPPTGVWIMHKEEEEEENLKGSCSYGGNKEKYQYRLRNVRNYPFNI
jgi:hypothetical protein